MSDIYKIIYIKENETKDIYIFYRNKEIIKEKHSELNKLFKSNPEDNIFKFCKNKKYDDVWIIGGEQRYKMFLSRNIIKQIYATVIHKNYQCDAFFNSWDKKKFFELDKTTASEKVLNDDISIDYITYQLDTNID